MAELVLSPVISVLVKKSADLVLGEFHTGLETEEYCKKLYRILPAVQAVVEDVEKRSETESSVREWMRSLKAAAYEAEDVLDELKYNAIKKAIEVKAHSERKVQLCLPACSLPRSYMMSYSHGKRLKAILNKIDVVISEMNKFGFLITPQAAPKTVIRSRSISLVEESTVIGRNGDLEKMVAVILGQIESERVSVLPIVGMGGLGKTTLAQLVYNSERIQKHFELKMWVCVSDEFHVTRITKSMIDVAIGKDSKLPLDNTELISQRLRELLGFKKYFLILDDVWNEIPNKWEELKLLLDCGSSESVVIVTTRSQKVALIMGTMDAYNLQGLNEDDLWGIFKQKAFRMGTDERPELVEIGRQLLKKCCGSPLAATTFGGLLSYKNEEREWLNVLEDNSLTVKNEIMSVLKLSYDNMPSHMKQCFAFCAVYPKNYEMERDTLIQLWMANSYIPLEENMEIEDKGMEIFNELAWRGFFQNIIKNYRGIVVCKMHDLVHDLAQYIVGKVCIRLSDWVQENEVLSKETLHVSFSSKQGTHSLLKKYSSIHTILSLFDDCMNMDIDMSRVSIGLSKAQSWRALSFRRIDIREIRTEPTTLIHLRYLDLSDCTLEVLPETLCTSYNLQILKLSGCTNLVCLPEGMRQMRSLRHLYLDRCYRLKRMPAGLGKLRSLQTLTKYIINPAIGCGIEELKDLNLRGQLQLYGLDKVGNKHEAKLANLISKKTLIKLELRWGNNCSQDPYAATDILDGLEPCRALESLDISSYDGTYFASWMHNSTMLKNLTRLTMYDCKRCTILPPLWQLPSLNVLHLIGLESLKHMCSGRSVLLAHEVQGDGNQTWQMFPKLQWLYLDCLMSLESWQEDDLAKRTSLALPQLCDLRIINCPKLDALPFCPSLSLLMISETSNIPFSAIESFKNSGIEVRMQ